MVDRKRKTVKYAAESLDIDYCKLGQALERIQYLIDKYGKDAYIDTQRDPYLDPYSDREYLYVYAEREETDGEMADRIENEKRWEKLRNEAELKEFERLKAKFDSK